MKKVLILSAAAKVLLVQAFQSAGAHVIAADLTPDAAALRFADQAVILPRSDEADFANALLDLVQAQGIHLVVPTRDAELPVIASLEPRLQAAGATPLVPRAESLAICQDKRRFVAFCLAEGFPVPTPFTLEEKPSFPVFARPATGAGGRGTGRADDAVGLAAFGPRSGLVVQPLIEAPEYTIDVLMDLSGAPLQAVARRRLAVHAGEAWKSRVEDAPDLTGPALALAARLGLVGHNVIQAFRTDDGPLFIECNPRFGGASNLSIEAGLDSPARILALLDGDASAQAARPIRHGLTALRYAQDILIEPDA